MKSCKQSEKCNTIPEEKEIEKKIAMEKKDIATNDKIIKEITKLNLKDDNEK